MESLGDRFEILHELGKGGMGVVYLARQRSLDRLVAVKELLPENDADEQHIQRFHREAKLLRGINHPHIAHLLDYELTASGGYMVFEYIEGGTTLADLLTAQSVDWDGALAVALGVADALGFLHGRGIIHRDVKPGNILVGPQGVAKLIDLGLGRAFKACETRLTQDGQSLGTLAYMSPEQLLGGEVNTQSDVYSFGLVLYELIARRLVFSAQAEAAIYATKRLAGNVPPIRKFRRDVPPALERLLDRTLGVDWTQRPVDARVVYAELANIAESEELGKLPRTQEILLPKAKRAGPPQQGSARATGRTKPMPSPLGGASGVHMVRAAPEPSIARRAMPWLAVLVAVLLPAVYAAGLRQGQSVARAVGTEPSAVVTPSPVPLVMMGSLAAGVGIEEAARLREALERSASAIGFGWLTAFASEHRRNIKKAPAAVSRAMKEHLSKVGILGPLEQFLPVASSYFDSETIPVRERWATRYLLCDLEILEEFCAIHAIAFPWGDTSVTRVFPWYDEPVDIPNLDLAKARTWVRASNKPANRWFPGGAWEETWTLPTPRPDERLFVWFSLARWKPGVLLDVRLDRRVRRIIRYAPPISDPPPLPVHAVEYELFGNVTKDVTIKLTETLRFPRAYAGRWFPHEGIAGKTHLKVSIVDLPLRGMGADDPSIIDRIVTLSPAHE